MEIKNVSEYRVFHQGVKGIRKLYPVNKIWEIAEEKVSENPESDFYESIYIYTDEQKEILKNTKSLAGIRDILTDRIVLDFDNEKNPDLARLDTISAIERLSNYFPMESIQIYFSGNKGYHVVVQLDEKIHRNKFEQIIYYFAEGLQTFDEKIKDEQRLFRFPLTMNVKTKRYKVPLTFEELNSGMDVIYEKASNPNIDECFDLMHKYLTVSLPENLVYALDIVEKESKSSLDDVIVTDRPDFSRKPDHLTMAKYALLEGFFEEGERNEACMILAATYKYLGYDEAQTSSLLEVSLNKRAKRLNLPEPDISELEETIIKPVFSPLWKGGLYSEDEGLLKRVKIRFNIRDAVGELNLVSLPAVSSQFRDFAANIDSNTIKLGIDEIDKKVRITTGMLVPFLAAPGAGKSSLSFGVLNTLSNNGEKGIFFSMDMGAPQVFQRLIQRHTKHDSDKILNNYKNNVVGEIQNYENILTENYKNIKFCFKTSVTPELIRETIIKEYEITGSYPKMILLDYLECISTGTSDPTQSKAIAALALKDIANEFNICVFLLTQPAKMSGSPENELNSYFQIKGSGVVAEQATVVLTMSRPGFSPKNPENDNYVTINVVKNRMGSLSSTDLHWDGLTGHIRSLTNEEEKDLDALRNEILAEKNKDKGDLY